MISSAVAGLSHSDPRSPGISRVRVTSGFGYRNPAGLEVTDFATLERIHALVLPPENFRRLRNGYRAMSRSAWTAAVNRRPQRQARPPGTTPATHLIQTVQSNSALQNQAQKQGNQTEIKPSQTEKIYRGSLCIMASGATGQNQKSLFIAIFPFKGFQRHSKHFRCINFLFYQPLCLYSPNQRCFKVILTHETWYFSPTPLPC